MHMIETTRLLKLTIFCKLDKYQCKDSVKSMSDDRFHYPYVGKTLIIILNLIREATVAMQFWLMWCHTGMQCRRQRTWHPILSQYIHGVDLSLCSPLMWSFTLESTTTHFNVLGLTRLRNPSPDLQHTKRMLNIPRKCCRGGIQWEGW